MMFAKEDVQWCIVNTGISNVYGSTVKVYNKYAKDIRTWFHKSICQVSMEKLLLLPFEMPEMDGLSGRSQEDCIIDAVKFTKKIKKWSSDVF